MAATGKRPLLLVSNDDGVGAAGLKALREALQQLGDVVVVAPESNQSAGSHSITIERPLRHRRVDTGVHAVDGTPADCIFIALHRQTILPRRPDLVVSGINHGPNLGNDIYYSGTVAAAREGALRGIPAMACSLCGGSDFTAAAALAATLARRLLASELPSDQAVLLNVNFPPAPYRGVRATQLGSRRYDDEVTVRHDPRGREYYWIGGSGAHHDWVDGSDTAAIDQRCVSVTPLQLRGTHDSHAQLAALVADVVL